ncbi:MAG TPA: hypothetical protein EYP88_06235 [Anaerolineales bacterium]|nr:hypothetical protein [Anaerolineales bacterium]
MKQVLSLSWFWRDEIASAGGLEMPTDNDFWVITLGLIGAFACVAGGFVGFWYMIKYSIASTLYLRTRDETAWRKTVRKAATKAAVSTGILMFVAIQSCGALVFLELLDLTLARLIPMIVSVTIFGILASVLAAGYILLHARWQDLMNMVIDWHQKRRRCQDGEESSHW